MVRLACSHALASWERPIQFDVQGSDGSVRLSLLCPQILQHISVPYDDEYIDFVVLFIFRIIDFVVLFIFRKLHTYYVVSFVWHMDGPSSKVRHSAIVRPASSFGW